MKTYVFKCIRAGGPGPAVHMDSCADDSDARRRALSLFEIWPLAVKVDVTQGERHFEVARPIWRPGRQVIETWHRVRVCGLNASLVLEIEQQVERELRDDVASLRPEEALVLAFCSGAYRRSWLSPEPFIEADPGLTGRHKVRGVGNAA